MLGRADEVMSSGPQVGPISHRAAEEPLLPRRGGAGRDSAKAATPAPQDLCMILKLVDCDGYHELDYGYGRLTCSYETSRRYAKGIMMSFKRLPVTLLPIILLAVIVAMFIFYVPAGGDLISRWGDIVLGGLLTGLFCACVRADLLRFRKLAAVRRTIGYPPASDPAVDDLDPELDALANKSGDEKK